MLSRPTTDQVLDGIVGDLSTTVIPALPDGQALQRRSDREMRVVGTLDLVGRG